MWFGGALIHVVAAANRIANTPIAVEYHPESGKRPMSRQDRISLHVGRAFEELDRARSAASPEAAIAHLTLFELHLGRMKALSETAAGPGLRLVE